MKNVTEVRYKVTDAFGDSDIGDIRVAYVIGGEALTTNAVMVYHPKERGLCSSLELCRSRGQKHSGLYLFQSLDQNCYVNITSQQNKVYEQIVADAGFVIPKKMLVEAAPPPPPRLRKR